MLGIEVEADSIELKSLLSFFLSQLLSNYEVVAQRTFAFVPLTLLLSDLRKLVEART